MRKEITLAFDMPAATPENFDKLRAFYFTLQALADDILDMGNRPMTEDIGDEMNAWDAEIRHAQEAVVNTIRAIPPFPKDDRTFDLNLKIELLLHWAIEGGHSGADYIRIVADELAKARA